jgi:hypothetical protein
VSVSWKKSGSAAVRVLFLSVSLCLSLSRSVFLHLPLLSCNSREHRTGGRLCWASPSSRACHGLFLAVSLSLFVSSYCSLSVSLSLSLSCSSREHRTGGRLLHPGLVESCLSLSLFLSLSLCLCLSLCVFLSVCNSHEHRTGGRLCWAFPSSRACHSLSSCRDAPV